MDTNSQLRKGLVFGIIIILVGTSVVATLSSEKKIDETDSRGSLEDDRGFQVFYPSDDVCIGEDIPNENIGYSSLLRLRTLNNWKRYNLANFDISSIPTGTNISSATLKLYYFDYTDGNPTGHNVSVYRVTAEWAEDVVTWNTQPAHTTVSTDYSIVPSSFGWMEWDVTSDVQNFINGLISNFGWKFIDINPSEQVIYNFHSKEFGGDLIPTLEIITISPLVVFVDDDFNSSTPGWGYDHFSSIQAGVDAVDVGGTVFVYNGTYYESIIMNKALSLIGKNKESSIIDGNGSGDFVVHVSCSGVNISGFTFSNCIFDAIWISADHNSITNSIFSNSSWCGIEIEPGYQNIIQNNIFLTSGYGIVLDNISTNNTIADNVFSNISNSSAGYGLWFHDAHGNIITNNTLINNRNGMYLQYSDLNYVNHNNFINNTQNAYDEGTNLWYNATLQEGNYWSDYTGEDNNHDGIGDIPYSIPGGSNQDLYPFIQANGWELQPIAYWNFDEETGSILHDKSGNSNDGTIYGAQWTNGISGGGLSFDGSDDYVNCGNNPILNINNEITISAWIKYNPLTYWAKVIVGKWCSPSSHSYVMILYNREGNQIGKPGFSVSYGNDLWSEFPLQPGTWYFLTGTYNQNTSEYKFYLNGTFIASTIFEGGISQSNEPLYIGGDTEPKPVYFNGIIDEVRIYNRALNETEIQSLYEKNRPVVPSYVYVNDDFNETTPGWGYDHFDVIQDGINAVSENGTVFVFNGTYFESITINKNNIRLIGGDKHTTIIDSSGYLIGIAILENCNNNLITCFTVKNATGECFYLSSWTAHSSATCDSNTIDDCIICNCNGSPGAGAGIGICGERWTNHADYNTIINCEIFNCTRGIDIQSGDGTSYACNNRVLNSTIYNNGIGVQIDNGLDGGNLYFNTIINCSIQNNDNYGIYIQDAYSNLIYHNNIRENGQNAFDDSSNLWYNGSLQEGNYWLDYTGEDNNHDGIGDTPYNIPGGNNQDLFPLMNSKNNRLIAYWSFDEGNGTIAHDVSYHGHTGTIQNGIWTTGVSGTALEFNHTGNVLFDTVELGTEWSASYWVKLRAYNVDSSAILGYSGSEYVTEIWTNTKKAVTANDSNCWAESNPMNWTDGNWYHVGITMKNGIATYYINGENETYDPDFGPRSMRIQAIAGHGDSVNWLNGTIDEVRIYDFALSEEEMLGLFINHPPTPQNDSITVLEDSMNNSCNVLSNDFDPDNDPLIIDSFTTPLHGSATTNGTTIIYSPDPNYYGIDTLTYIVTDGFFFSNPAVVTITVTPVNDPPVAMDDVSSTAEDTVVVIPILSNDYDIDGTLNPATVTIETPPMHGSYSVDSGTGAVTYTPILNYNGHDSLSYTVKDNLGATSNVAMVNITVSSVNDPPVAVNDTAMITEDSQNNQIDVLQNDYDIDGLFTIVSVTQPTHGFVSTDGSFVYYTPAANYCGLDQFTYTISDGNGYCKSVLLGSKSMRDTDTATVFITVIPVNDPPNKPERPSGSIEGKINVEYTYTTSTIDIEGDLVWYWFDWDDGTNSGWVGPYPSGAIASAPHTWTTKGSYNIKVKAVDPSNNESDWSDPLPITMPLDLVTGNTMLQKQVYQSPNEFQLLKLLHTR